jgi:hypothetical protein
MFFCQKFRSAEIGKKGFVCIFTTPATIFASMTSPSMRDAQMFFIGRPSRVQLNL